MSIKAMSWAWEVEGIPAMQKFLLIALADFADEANTCYPGQARLARMVGTTRETVSRNLAALQKVGLIERTERRRNDGYRTSDRFTLKVGHKISCDKNSHDYLSRDFDTRSHVTQTGGQEPSEEPSVDKPSIVSLSSKETFESFWKIYPRKAGKATAVKAFEKAVKRSKDPNIVIEGARRLAEDPNLPEKQFIPHPSTWLNRDGWEDEPLPARSSRGGAGSFASSAAADAHFAAQETDWSQGAIGRAS